MRFAISVVVASLALLVAVTAAAADVPACEELLTKRQAADAMDVEEAVIALREVYGNTRYCSWFGAPQGAQRIQRSVAVKLGPYADFRRRTAENGRKLTCATSAAACKALDRALKVKSNLASFAYFGAALDKIGVAKRLPSSAMGGNPAFIWDPNDEWIRESGLGPTMWVFVYLVKSQSLLSILCGSVGEPPTQRCALAGAKGAYNNITS